MLARRPAQSAACNQLGHYLMQCNGGHTAAAGQRGARSSVIALIGFD